MMGRATGSLLCLLEATERAQLREMQSVETR